jgi:hypothetical protein
MTAVTPDAAHRLGQQAAIQNVATNQRDAPGRKRSRDASDGLSVACRQIVVDHDIETRRRQSFDRVAADVARAARHEHRAHGRPIDL